MRLSPKKAIASGAALATLALTSWSGSGTAYSLTGDALKAQVGFTPITGPALTCDATAIRWAPEVAPTAQIVMQRGDAATPGPNAQPTQTSVPGENDMNAFVGNDTRYLYTVSETGTNGAVTRLDTVTGDKTILAQLPPSPGWRRLDPVKWHAPSGKLLIGEETTGGLIYQVDPTTGAYASLPWLGAFGHEGLTFGSDGAIWQGDENHRGVIFRAVANNPSDLTQGGTLAYMVDGVGFTTVSNPANAAAEGFAGGATLFDRPEDFDARNGRIYFTVTEGPDVAAQESASAGRTILPGGVYSVNDSGVPHTSLIVAVNDPGLSRGAGATSVSGLQYPDNIAFDSKGNLYIHEDVPDNFSIDYATGRFTSGPNMGQEPAPTTKDAHTKQFRNQQDELWVAVLSAEGTSLEDGTLHKFADLANSRDAKPCENEWTGGVFAAPGIFYVNQQHADNPTWRTEVVLAEAAPACQGQPATIVGTSGPDRLFGTTGPDVIVGLGGNDSIYGYGGDDIVCAGDGDDVVYGGVGNDFIDGGTGDDRVVGDAGDDLLRGGTGSDRLFGGDGNDRLDAGPAVDYCYGGMGTNTFTACEVYPTGM